MRKAGKNKIDIRAVVAAVAAGGGFEFAMQGLAKRVDFVNQNYLVTSSLSASVIGTGLIYFGRDNVSQAAGYAMLGVAGQKGAAKVSTLIVSTEEGGMNGIGEKRAKNLRGMLSRRKPGADQVKRNFVMPGARGREQRPAYAGAPVAQPGGQPNRVQPAASNYGALAYADAIYQIPS